jgi:hypothetical protein
MFSNKMKIASRIFVVAFLALIGFSSCEQPASPGEFKENDYVNFFNDSIIKEVKKAVPKNWSVTNDSAYTLTLMSNDYIQICNFTNAEDYAGNDYSSYVKDKIVAKQFFKIYFIFKKKMTDEEIIMANAKNDWVDKKVNQLYEKYGFNKAEMTMNNFSWRTKADSLKIVSFKKEKSEIEKQRIPIPDFSTKTNDIYISNNLPFPNASLCYPNQEKEVEDLIYKIEGILGR